jgi:RNA polymerase sigma-54 factor
MTFATQLHNIQVQSLAVTPQLIQSLQLLQYSGQELDTFLKEEVEKNPLIEITRQKLTVGFIALHSASSPSVESSNIRVAQAEDGPHERQRMQQQVPLDAAVTHNTHSRRLLSAAGGSFAKDGYNLDARCAAGISLGEHLRSQLMIAVRPRSDFLIGLEIIDAIDPDGYLRQDLNGIANKLSVPQDKVASILKIVQSFEPAGIGARNLAECLKIQLREKGGLDLPMSLLLDNLSLLAEFRIPELAKICGVSTEDVLEMAKAIRKLDPRPGRAFDAEPTLPAMPDVLVTMQRDGTITVDLNPALLPKILIDREYYSKISAGCSGKEERKFVVDCFRTATWLERNLDQRAQTILKVSTEIMARQRDFLVHGAEFLRPLSLRDVAQAVGLHESTVSRATANKYVSTSRGTFELKFFFRNSIASYDGGADFSSETIRHKIKQLIDAETAETVLSDDALVGELRRSGIDIARRTVAKYRDAMNIGSSLQRRRQKHALATLRH